MSGKAYFKLDDSTFVIVDVTIVRSGKDSNDNREFRRTIPFVHFVTIKLSFMSSQNRKEFVFMKELVSCLLSKEV